MPAGLDPRQKIENLVKKGGVPDEDAPDDPESTRFWCHTGSKFTDREKMSLTQESVANVRTTSASMEALLSTPTPTPLALTNGGSSTTSGPSLESLVNVMNGTTTTSAKAKAKGKAKAKAKTAPKSTLQTPKTPEEHRDAIRFLA